jgi:hypothetical protein
MVSVLWLKWPLILLGIGVLLFACHKFLSWMEGRGWIYYHKKKASPGTAASAWLELQSMVEPGTKHVLRVEREERQEDDGEGGPDI